MGTETPVKLTCKQKILRHLEVEDLKLAWLARKTGIIYATLYAIFKENRIPLTQDRLTLINTALQTNFELGPAEEKTTC